MPTEIDSLQIKIESQANDAAKSIDALAVSLNNLKNTGKLTTVKNNLNNLSAALKEFQTSYTGVQKFKELANGLNKLSSVKLSGFNSAMNSLKKLPEITKSLDAATLNSFADACQQVSTALSPLSTKLATVSSGLGNMPSRMKQSVNAVNNYSKAANSAVPATEKLAKALTSLKARFGIITVVAQKVFSTIGSWVNNMNSYVENINLFTVSMGEYADEAMEYAETVHDAMGIDVSEFIRNQGIFMSMATGFGLASDKAYEMSKGLTELSYDLASFFNISLDAVGDGAFSKVQSGIAGELEPLRRLGFALSEASLQQVAYSHGINMSVREMTEAQKATLRYTAMVEQAADMGAIGDMARTLVTPANAVRILKQQLNELTRSLGSLFIPILMKVIPYVQAFVDILTEGVQKLASFMGFTLPKIDYSGVSNATGEMAENLGDATEEAKALKSQMLGIDELNVVSQDSGAGASASTGNGLGSDLGLDVSSIWNESMLNGIKNGVDEVKKKLEPMLETAVLIGGAFLAWKIAKSFLTALDTAKLAVQVMSGVHNAGNAAALFGFNEKTIGFLEKANGLLGKTAIGELILGKGTSIGTTAAALGTVVAAIAAVAGGLVIVYNKSENFRTGLSTIVDGIKFLIGKVGEFFSWVVDGISGLIPQGVVDFIAGLDLSIGDLLITAGGLALFGPLGLLIEGAVLAIKAIGYAASDSLEPVNLFGDGISEATEQKVAPFLTKMDELEQTFLNIDWGNIPITMTDVATIKAQLGEIVSTITAELDADKNEALANIDPLKGAMDAESFAGIVAKVEESYALQTQKVQEGSDAINAIVAQAAAEGRTITDEEAAEIARIQEEMKTTGIKYLSESETESNLILTRLKDNATQLSAEQASEVIKKAIETRDATITAANEQYDGIALEAQRMLDTGVITKDEYDKIIAAAESTRKETVDKANNQYNSIVKTAKSKMGEYAKYIDTETGEIKSNWKVFCEDLGKWWGNLWGSIKTWWSNGWDSATKWFNTSVKPWFTKEKWAEIFGGIKEGLKATLTNAINAGIDKLNQFIGWINDKMSFTVPGFSIGGGSIDIPDWLGGGSFDIPSVGWSSKDVTLISIPTIAKFANGGFIEDGLFTMNHGEIAGKFSNGKSVVANNEQIIAGISEGVYSAVVAAMGNGGGRESQNVNVYLDGKQIYSSVKRTESERGKQIFGNQLGYGY